MNLTLASPSVNRHQKSGKDAAEWLPELNASWYVDRIIQVRLEYGLTIDHTEADAIDAVLATCDSTDMALLAPTMSDSATATPTPTPPPSTLTPSLHTTTTGTAGSVALRPEPTASHLYTADTQRMST